MDDIIKIPVIKGKVLGVTVYRGYAPLFILSKISKADVFDAKKNPTGTQRDLNLNHAKLAYEYVKTREFAFWPEVFLCIREDGVVKYNNSSENYFGYLEINYKKIKDSNKILISRVDGNHRLYFADGENEGYTKLEKEVSFCITDKLKKDEEIILFRDINNNQRRMNTSHLDNIDYRLTDEEKLKKSDSALYISKKLNIDKNSPLYERIYEGGIKVNSVDIPLRNLKTGISYMFSRPTRLTALKDPDAQYKLILNYFKSIKIWIPEAWEKPRDYLVLRGSGLWAICFIGAEIIDRVLSNGKFETDDMLNLLKSGKTWDWTSKGDFTGYGGRGGAAKIRDLVIAELNDDTGYSLKDLYNKIMEK